MGPEFVQIYPNPDHQYLGDSYFTPEYVETIHYESRTGRVPVKGAGFRDPFGGLGRNGASRGSDPAGSLP